MRSPAYCLIVLHFSVCCQTRGKAFNKPLLFTNVKQRTSFHSTVTEFLPLPKKCFCLFKNTFYHCLNNWHSYSQRKELVTRVTLLWKFCFRFCVCEQRSNTPKKLEITENTENQANYGKSESTRTFGFLGLHRITFYPLTWLVFAWTVILPLILWCSTGTISRA